MIVSGAIVLKLSPPTMLERMIAAAEREESRLCKILPFPGRFAARVQHIGKDSGDRSRSQGRTDGK